MYAFHQNREPPVFLFVSVVSDLRVRCNRYMLGPEGLVDAFVAEHVWEHLSLEDAHRATRNCQRHLRPGGRLRLAVPDPAWHSSASAGFSSTVSASPTQTSTPSGSVTSGEHDGGGKPATADKNRDASNGSVSRREPSGGESFQGKRGSSSEGGGVARKEVPLGQEERSSDSGSPAIPVGLDLPGWLSRDMLAADARDGHLVQFTPELLANVCWSAGLTPVLVEGGSGGDGGGARDRVHPSSASSGKAASTTTTASGATEEEIVVPGFGTIPGIVNKDVYEDDAGDDAEVSNGAGDHEKRGGMKAPRHQKPSPPLTGFSTAGKNDVEEEERHHRWGRIKRSVAGGDPRGAVSIVMDCIKPLSKDDNEDDHLSVLHHLEALGAAGRFADNKPYQGPTEDRPDGLNDHTALERSEDISSQNFSSLSSSLSSQQRPSVTGTGLSRTGNFTKSTKTVDETDASRVSFAGAAIGITSGIGYGHGYGYGTDAGVGGGVVAVSKGAAAAAPAAAALKMNPRDIGDGGISSATVLRPVLRRPVDSNGAGGLGGTFGGGMGVATTGCRGMLCDGGGQSGDAAGSGEGG